MAELNRSVSRAASIVLVFAILAVLLRCGRLFVVDFFSRVLLFELNAYWNRCRVKGVSRGTIGIDGKCARSCAVACVIGYREERRVFRQCLESYRQTQGDGILVVCIDGTSSDDMEMHAVYEEIFGHDTTGLITIDEPLSEMLRNIWESISARDPDQVRAIVRDACRTVHTLLVRQGKLPRTTPTKRFNTVCFAQPHTNVRGIRFAGWILSLVIAEANDICYIWSSDSDTAVVGNCILEAVKVLEGSPSMGGISTAISVQRAPKSTAALLAWTQHRCLIYLDAAFTASIGHSSCLTGPSTLYRAEALAQAIMPWYLATDISDGSSPRMMANDDNQITTCLGRLGWKRGYLTDHHVRTCAPGSLLDWVRQQCRWNRAYNHERFNHLWYSIDQGPLYLWWIVRDEVYDAMFMANLLCLICGMPLYAPHLSEWAAYFIAQPLYNYIRSPEMDRRFGDLFSLPGLIIFHHLSIQFVHVWSTLTPFEDVENTPAGERGTAPVVALSARDIAYISWVTTTGLLFARLMGNYTGIT